MQEALACILTEAGQPFEREVAVPNCTDAQLRPADLLLKNWLTGKDTALDLGHRSHQGKVASFSRQPGKT